MERNFRAAGRFRAKKNLPPASRWAESGADPLHTGLAWTGEASSEQERWRETLRGEGGNRSRCGSRGRAQEETRRRRDAGQVRFQGAYGRLAGNLPRQFLLGRTEADWFSFLFFAIDQRPGERVAQGRDFPRGKKMHHVFRNEDAPPGAKWSKSARKASGRLGARWTGAIRSRSERRASGGGGRVPAGQARFQCKSTAAGSRPAAKAAGSRLQEAWRRRQNCAGCNFELAWKSSRERRVARLGRRSEPA